MLISSTEPASIRALGESSKVPELFGSDILMATKAGAVGIQRKEINDFVASCRSHRVPVELAQMQKLAIGIWIIEGEWQWSTSGESLKVRGYSENEYLGAVFSILSRGYWVLTSRNMEGTITLLSRLSLWLEKETHDSLLRRPKPQGTWGKPDSQDFRLWFWQTFDGIGIKQAKAIDEYFNGKIPLVWGCDPRELANIDGMGPKRIKSIIDMFMKEGDE